MRMNDWTKPLKTFLKLKFYTSEMKQNGIDNLIFNGGHDDLLINY